MRTASPVVSTRAVMRTHSCQKRRFAITALTACVPFGNTGFPLTASETGGAWSPSGRPSELGTSTGSDPKPGSRLSRGVGDDQLFPSASRCRPRLWGQTVLFMR
jgi:hypothetical protein